MIFQALSSASSCGLTLLIKKRNQNLCRTLMTYSTNTYTNTEYATEKYVRVGRMVSYNTSVQSLEKKSFLSPPQNKNNQFNHYGCAMLQPQHGWQDPAEVAPATGDGDKARAGLQGNYRVVWRRRKRAGDEACLPLPAVSPESYCLQRASSSLFHLCPLGIIGNVVCVNMFFVSPLRFIVSVRRPVYPPSM